MDNYFYSKKEKQTRFLRKFYYNFLFFIQSKKTNLKIIYLIFLIFPNLIFYSCSNQGKKFKEVCQTNNLNKAYEFKNLYPNSRYNIDSIIYVLEYIKIKNILNIADMKTYLAKFPKSIYRDSVEILMFKSEWDKIFNSNNAETINNYISKYPKSPFVEFAEEWLFNNANEGIYIDKRNGAQYNWYKIDNLIWMSIDKKIAGHDINDYDRTRNNDEVAKSFCPDGWHIPNQYEWIKSIEYYTGKKYFENSGEFINNKMLEKLIGNKSNNFFKHENQNFLTSPISSWTKNEYGYNSIRESYSEDQYYFQISSRIYNGDGISIICVKDYDINEVFKSPDYAIDIDGNIYRTIKIKNKIWFYDDLYTSRFSNGDIIPNLHVVYSDYDKKNIYQIDAFYSGKLYSGYVVQDSRNVCPSGWHVATSNEWNEVLNSSSNELKFYTNGLVSCKYPNIDQFSNAAFFWCSDGYYIKMPDKKNIKNATGNDLFNSGFNVRCVKNY